MNNEKINVLAFASSFGMLQRDFYVLEKKFGRIQTKTVQEWNNTLKDDFTIPNSIPTENLIVSEDSKILDNKDFTKSKEVLKNIKQKSETEE